MIGEPVQFDFAIDGDTFDVPLTLRTASTNAPRTLVSSERLMIQTIVIKYSFEGAGRADSLTGDQPPEEPGFLASIWNAVADSWDMEPAAALIPLSAPMVFLYDDANGNLAIDDGELLLATQLSSTAVPYTAYDIPCGRGRHPRVKLQGPLVANVVITGTGTIMSS